MSSKVPGFKASAAVPNVMPTAASHAAGASAATAAARGEQQQAERGHRPDPHEPDPLADPRREACSSPVLSVTPPIT
jgi:hypothetical protein